MVLLMCDGCCNYSRQVSVSPFYQDERDWKRFRAILKRLAGFCLWHHTRVPPSSSCSSDKWLPGADAADVPESLSFSFNHIKGCS